MSAVTTPVTVGGGRTGRPRLDDKKNAVGSIDSLCWYCRNAYASCSWSKFFVPVDGWDAKPTRHNSFRVYRCPKFIRG